MSVRVIFELHVKPRVAEAMKQSFRDMLPDTRSFEGCEEITILECQDDPNLIVALEQWETREHYEACLKWRTDRGDMDNVAAASTAPYKISFFDYVGA